MGNQIFRTGGIIAGGLIVAVLLFKVIGRGGHSVANTASNLEQKF